MEKHETPTECIIREFKEETGLELIYPALKGISYWQAKKSGVIFIYAATEFAGKINEVSQEGELHWLTIEEAKNVEQFPMNELFFNYLLGDKIFEGKFIYDENDTTVPERVVSHSIRLI